MRRTPRGDTPRKAHDSKHHDGVYRNGTGVGGRSNGKLEEHGKESVRRAIVRMSTRVARGAGKGESMPSRRTLLVIAGLMLPGVAIAQPASGLAGRWQGQVDGIGAATLIITAIRPSGQVEGRMEFALQSFVSTFGDKADNGLKTSYGTASGTTLRIDSALGGTYVLTLQGDQLAGTYTRGTTFSGNASFKRS